MAYEGSLSESPFPEVLQHIGRSGDTGILTLQGEEEIIGVTFLRGHVVSVDAVNQAPEEGLGQVLDREGLVPIDEFSSLVAENRAGGGRVVDLLLERNFLGRDQLLAALRKQTLKLCAEACTWGEGQFRFYRGDQVSYEEGIEPIHVDDLLGRLAGPTQSAGPPEAQAATVSDDEVPEVEVLEFDAPSAVDLDFDLAIPPAVELPEIEYPDVEPLDPAEFDDVDLGAPKRGWQPEWASLWKSIKTPVMPGRLLGLGLLASLVALVLLAPGRLLVPLDGQARIRSGLANGVQSSLYAKVDRAAKTYFLLRGTFPQRLQDLVDLNLLDPRDLSLPNRRALDYTEAPLSYLLAVEGEARVDRAVRTETIAGNFLLDPDFSPAEVLESPVLVLLD